MSIFEAIKNKFKNHMIKFYYSRGMERHSVYNLCLPVNMKLISYYWRVSHFGMPRNRGELNIPRLIPISNTIYKKLGVSSRAQLIINYKDIKLGGNT